MNVFENYANYYDLLYQDKNYHAEVDYIDSLIKKYSNNSNSILELGCGTGKHAALLVEKGYNIWGVDISEKMIKLAKDFEKQANLFEKLSFSLGDMKSVRLNRKFDVVTSLFHVVSYQTTNQDLQKTFSTANLHLKKDGIFIFDCWYGPAVLTDLPKVRVKKIENEFLKITRISEPTINFNENVVEVNYQIFIKDKIQNKYEEIKETHEMRYLFKPEIEKILNENGFALIDAQEWLTGKQINSNTFGACFIGKKICE